MVPIRNTHLPKIQNLTVVYGAKLLMSCPRGPIALVLEEMYLQDVLNGLNKPKEPEIYKLHYLFNFSSRHMVSSKLIVTWKNGSPNGGESTIFGQNGYEYYSLFL